VFCLLTACSASNPAGGGGSSNDVPGVSDPNNPGSPASPTGGTPSQNGTPASNTPTAPSFPWVTDLSSHAVPNMTLPAKYGSYTDPDFGTKIIRATDETDGTSCVNAYAYWPAFNTDSSRLLISCDGVARLYNFDKTTDKLTYVGPLDAGGPGDLEFEGAFWSHSEPSVLYALGGTKLWRVDVAQTGAGRYTLVHDFAGIVGYPFVAWQLGKADDDNEFTFTTKPDTSSPAIDAVVYKRDSNQTFIFPRPSSFLIDESQMSKDGQRVIIPSRDGSGEWRIWSWATGQVDVVPWDATARSGGHYDGGHAKLVNADNWQSGFQRRDWVLPGLETPQNFFKFVEKDGTTLNWTVPNHVSMRSDDESIVIASTYGSNGTGQPFEREVVLIRTDGSGFVRLGHTLGTRSDYFSEPRGVVDRSGKYVVYTSDLGSASRLDVMILKIPPQMTNAP
jgi:hypothetical protein